MKGNTKVKYNIYATLLDSFNYWLENDEPVEEMINKINRVPISDKKALTRMEKGTKFEEMINRLSKTGPVALEYEFEYNDFEKGKYQIQKVDPNVVERIILEISDSKQQMKVEYSLKTRLGFVNLYGYLDFIKEDKIIDLKTTSNVEIGKYYEHFQKDVYMLALNADGIEINEFVFLSTDFRSLIKESYYFDEKLSKNRLTTSVEHLIEFLEKYKDRITDKKIFNLQ